MRYEKLIKDSRDDTERACPIHETFQEDRTHVEAQHELLIDEMKVELCSIRNESQHKHCSR